MLNCTVQAAATLLQVLSCPILWKRDGKADAVAFAVGSCPSIHHPIDAAVHRQSRSGRSAARTLRAACRHDLSASDFRVTPGLRTVAISEHFEFDCAKAVTCTASRTIDTTDNF